jgi:hypothetical protein
MRGGQTRLVDLDGSSSRTRMRRLDDALGLHLQL